MALHLCERVSGDYIADLTHYAPERNFVSRAIGGFYTGDVLLENMARQDAILFYSTRLGDGIQEKILGELAWEGFIVEMRLILDGQVFQRSLKPELFHNRVKVSYVATIGVTANTGWDDNDDSQGRYGRVEYLDSQPGMTDAAALALQARRLQEFAWPRSRMIGGGEQTGRQGEPPILELFVAGFWATLFYRYRESTLTDAASTVLDTLLDSTHAEFVTPGRMESNTLSVRCDASPAQQVGGLISGVVEQGDASGNVWQGGVYADRKFVYEQAPTDWEYQLVRGRLYNRAGAAVIPGLLRPGFLLYNAASPMGANPAGTASDWDNPQISYVEGVEFDARGGLRWTYQHEEESIALLRERIRRGNV